VEGTRLLDTRPRRAFPFAGSARYGPAVRASDLLGPRGPLARAIDGYEHRPSQMAMADAVEDVLEHRGVLLVEAGTGTGKTWAYLVPALLSGKKVVVSTGTRTLQDQIMEHDVPLLRKHLGDLRDVRVACMKGLGNYLCLRRYEELRRSAAAGAGDFRRQLPVLEDWRQRTVSGDRADLRGLPEDAAIWGHVQSGSDTRIGARCSHHDECFVTRMRREAERADLVVVNHHLFFADLAMRGPARGQGAVLPDYDVVIFDEAHQMEDTATVFFGASVSTGMLERLARDAERTLAILGKRSHVVQSLREAADALFFTLPTHRGAERTPLEAALLRQAEPQLFALDDALEAVGSHFKLLRGESESAGQIARRCGQLRDDLGRISEGLTGRTVSWISKRGHGTAVGMSPVDVSDVLREELFLRSEAVVLTSATLTTGGDFAFVKDRLGVDFEVDELLLPSPFAYPEQAALYLPRHLPDPRAPRFLDQAADEVRALVAITGGGAFVLCTSFRAMRGLADRCRGNLGGLPVMVQGEAPKATILERFRREGNAVLFATASFWEGVDVPGEALRLVVIDKLPFGVPSDPLVKARCERLEDEGGKPFMELLVPSAALALKQGFGRLIRSTRDRGIVAILDSRILKKGYGRVFLESLPDASRCYSLEEARSFWEVAMEAAS